MSDEEYEYSDEEEEEQEEEGNDVGIEIENAFYEGDDCKGDDPTRARSLFEKVVQLEEEQGTEIKWRFKSLLELVKLLCRLGDAAGMIQRYREMLGYIAKGDAVSRNDQHSAINDVLKVIAEPNVPEAITSVGGMIQVYEITLATLKASNTEKLWFSTCVRYGRACLAVKDLDKLKSVLGDLHKACQLPDGSDDPAKGTNLLEVYALEIQWCSDTQNVAQMKTIYPKTLNLSAAVPDPRVMGPICEEGGKMYMGEKKWAEAFEEFYTSFRYYQESGNKRAKDALKYVVLANMLALSNIDPFAAREAKAYMEEPEVKAITALRFAYADNDLNAFEKVLGNKRNRILEDAFIYKYVGPLRRRMREQVLLNLVKPYKRLRLQFLQDELKMSAQEVESLLVDMILDKRIVGKMDQIQGFLLLEGASLSSHPVKAKTYEALEQWASTLEKLTNNLSSKIHV